MNQQLQFDEFLVAPLLFPPSVPELSAGFNLMAPLAPPIESGIENALAEPILFTPYLATSRNACSTLCPSLADDSKNKISL